MPTIWITFFSEIIDIKAYIFILIDQFFDAPMRP